MEELNAFIQSIMAVSKQDLDLLVPIAKTVMVKKKTNLLEQGQICKHIYFVKAGLFRMFYVDLEGNEVNTRFTSENNFIVDFQSFLTQKPSRYYWQAMADAVLLSFAFTDVQNLYESSGIWQRFGRVIAERVYMQLNERVEMLQFMSPEQRYEHVIRLRPELLNQISQFHLSSYLGIKPESLSRLRKRLHYK